MEGLERFLWGRKMKRRFLDVARKKEFIVRRFFLDIIFKKLFKWGDGDAGGGMTSVGKRKVCGRPEEESLLATKSFLKSGGKRVCDS